MKRIDKLVLGELMGPWAFGVAIFTVLIMAGTFLFKLSEYVVAGVPADALLKLTILVLPGIVVKTLSMAVLLATLLAFGRLSSDSEVVAIRASGASIYRIMAPVAAFSLAVSVVAFEMNEHVVAFAARKATELRDEIEKGTKGGRMPVDFQVFDEGKLRAMVMAQDFNLEKRSLTGAVVEALDAAGHPTYLLLADSLQWEDSKHWTVFGGTLLSSDGSYMTKLGRTYPLTKGIAEPPNPEDILAKTLKDLDTLSMAQMKTRIAAARMDPSSDPKQIANLEYGYYNKIALPLATLIFGLVGAPLGIRNHRTGAAVGFWLSVIIIFAYMMLANLMSIYAGGGVIPAYVASFTPLGIGLVLAIVLMYRRNQ